MAERYEEFKARGFEHCSPRSGLHLTLIIVSATLAFTLVNVASALILLTAVVLIALMLIPAAFDLRESYWRERRIREAYVAAMVDKTDEDLQGLVVAGGLSSLERELVLMALLRKREKSLALLSEGSTIL